jgi:hypothetical protein
MFHLCVCVCVFYSYVRLRPFCKTSLRFFWLCPFCKNLCLQRSLFEPILQKLMFTSFGCVDHFAKTFVDVLRLSPFCKNLCWSSSTAHFAKAYVDFLWLSPFCKRLCRHSLAVRILQKPVSTLVLLLLLLWGC